MILQAIDDLVSVGHRQSSSTSCSPRRPRTASITVLELSDTIDDAGIPALDLAGLASEEDIADLAEGVRPAASAAILVVELLWAKAFAGALFDAGGAVLARQGIPAPLVNAYLSENIGLKETIMMRRRGRGVSSAGRPHGRRRRNRDRGLGRGRRPPAGQGERAVRGAGSTRRSRTRLRWMPPQPRLSPMPRLAAPPPPPAAPAAPDLMAQLTQLGTLHTQGILSDDEFAAAKAKLLS